jgi:hypothetical protein
MFVQLPATSGGASSPEPVTLATSGEATPRERLTPVMPGEASSRERGKAATAWPSPRFPSPVDFL